MEQALKVGSRTFEVRAAKHWQDNQDLPSASESLRTIWNKAIQPVIDLINRYSPEIK